MFVALPTDRLNVVSTDAERRTRVAIVTGTPGDASDALAARLVADGMTVVVNHVGGRQGAEVTGTQRFTPTRGIYACRADVAAEAEVTALFAYTEAAFGGIDVVVHAPGTTLSSPSAGLSAKQLDRIHRNVIRAAFLVNRQAARQVRPGGAIINVTISVEQATGVDHATHAALNGVVSSISLMRAGELRGRDITVNVVTPGPAPDLADTVSFLAGPARWMSGQILLAHGAAATQLSQISRHTQPFR